MKNPLTLEERAQVPLLIEHDIYSSLRDISLAASGTRQLSPDEVLNKYQHVKDVLSSITTLCTYIDDLFFDLISAQDLENKLKQVVAVLGGPKKGISYSASVEISFTSNLSLLYTALFNLTKNAYGFKDDNDGKVVITVSEFSGGIPNAIYVSAESPTEGNFIRLAVQDNGPGFPSDKPLTEFLKLGVSTRGSNPGFGLYYVTLVCKALRSHLTIDSKQGETAVAIYHPLTLT